MTTKSTITFSAPVDSDGAIEMLRWVATICEQAASRVQGFEANALLRAALECQGAASDVEDGRDCDHADAEEARWVNPRLPGLAA